VLTQQKIKALQWHFISSWNLLTVSWRTKYEISCQYFRVALFFLVSVIPRILSFPSIFWNRFSHGRNSNSPRNNHIGFAAEMIGEFWLLHLQMHSRCWEEGSGRRYVISKKKMKMKMKMKMSTNQNSRTIKANRIPSLLATFLLWIFVIWKSWFASRMNINLRYMQQALSVQRQTRCIVIWDQGIHELQNCEHLHPSHEEMTIIGK